MGAKAVWTTLARYKSPEEGTSSGDRFQERGALYLSDWNMNCKDNDQPCVFFSF